MNYHYPRTLSFMENKNPSFLSDPGTNRSSVSADTRFNNRFGIRCPGKRYCATRSVKPVNRERCESTFLPLGSYLPLYQGCAHRLQHVHTLIAARATGNTHPTRTSSRKRVSPWPAHSQGARLSATFEPHKA